MLDFIWDSFFVTTTLSSSSELLESVSDNQSLVYSTLIIAILLTKGYGRRMALAIGRKILHEPSKKMWRAIRAIKARQIVFYGLRWGIPLHLVKDLLLLHRSLLRKGRKLMRTGERTHTKDLCKKQSLRTRSLNSTVALYRKLPLKSVSRAWGKVMAWDLPVGLREPLLGLYVWMYGVNLQEAADPDLKHYKNLSQFFRRTLKPGARLVDPEAPVTSPADGTVLKYGKVSKGVVEQVKGVNYAIKAFLGPLPTHAGTDSVAEYLHDHEYHDAMGIKPGYALYHCIIYLAPGDYHRFHSATDWNIAHRRHFPGDLLSVKPQIARWVQGLFNLNERVVYTGTWKHGYCSYTAVGATNVGSIKIYLDKELTTNVNKKYQAGVHFDKVINDENGQSIHVAKGEMFGEFNLGSTIVLMFEAPNNYKFSVAAGQKVQFGQSIGQFV